MGYYPFLFVFVLVIIFLFSTIISFIAIRKTDINYDCQHVIERDNSIKISLSLIHHSFIHCSKAIVTYKILDSEQNEVVSKKVVIYNNQDFEELLRHSGYYKLVIEKAYYYDILECLSLRRVLNKECYFYVFPKYVSIDNYLKQNIGFTLESSEYDMLNKGNDYSEVFEIREYNEFDSLKHIHWKASMKKGDLYVKEGSQPILKKLLITISLIGNKDEIDEALDIFYSLCLSLLKKGIDYEIICPALGEQKYNIELIKNDVYLKECLQRILSTSYHDVDNYIQSIKDYSTLYIVKGNGIEVKEI
ncbi:MAG: DUF58 domain-containing protein [Coprobacillus sp.]